MNPMTSRDNFDNSKSNFTHEPFTLKKIYKKFKSELGLGKENAKKDNVDTEEKIKGVVSDKKNSGPIDNQILKSFPTYIKSKISEFKNKTSSVIARVSTGAESSGIIPTSSRKQKTIDVAKTIHELKDIHGVEVTRPKSGQKIIDQNNNDYRSNASKISIDTEKIELQNSQLEANAALLRKKFNNQLQNSSTLEDYRNNLYPNDWELFKQMMIEEILYAGSQSIANEISLQSHKHVITIISTELEFTTDPLGVKQHVTAKFIPHRELAKGKNGSGKKFEFDITVNFSPIVEHYIKKIVLEGINTIKSPDANLDRSFNIVNMRKMEEQKASNPIKAKSP